jgi:isopentenyldiphosphate isomerase
VDDGIIPRAKLRDELQDVHPFSAGFVVAGKKGATPALRMERAAMIYFGVPSYGVHVNGWVRDPENPSSPVPWAMWVGTRSMSKATYPGLLDQMVAGGQPSVISFDENVRKECEEEASLPPEVIASIECAGSVAYRYTTPKGLSTKVLMAYDLEMPQGLSPLCADGEVEEFRLLRVDEVLRSLREDLPLWKPNSALIAIDFFVRHGLVDEAEEPGYAELVRLLNQTLI